MHTDSFVKKDIVNCKRLFHVTNYVDKGPLPIGLRRKVIEFMKDELGGNKIHD